MKLSFTTLGCPKWSLKEIVENASRMGFDGVELRGVKDEIDISRLPEFTTDLEETKNLFSEYGVSVSAVDVSARFAVVSSEEKEKSFEETRRNLKVASQLSAPVLRVFGGRIPEGYSLNEMISILAGNLREIAGEAEELGVKIALETHDDWIDSSIVSRVMEMVDHPYIGVLWDMHHPFRLNHEEPEETYENLAPYIINVHVKDSIIDEKGQIRYVPPGEGDVPLKRMLELLLDGGYDGYITFEWEKRWHPELMDPEIVFPKFVEKMREWFK